MSEPAPAAPSRATQAIALALALASTAAALWWLQQREPGRAVPAAARTPGSADAPLPVRVITVAPESFAPTIVAPGTLVAGESVELVAELTKRLVKIHVDEGAVVRKGDVLFELDDDDLLARRMRLRAQRGLARRTVERDDELVATGIAAVESLDQSRTNLDDAQAQLVELEVMLGKTRIRAPFSGTIGIRHVSEGAWVGPGVALASLYDTSRLKLDFRVPERYAAAIPADARFEFTVTGDATRHEGRVTVVEPQLEQSTRSLIVRGVVERPGALRPGQFTTVELTAAPTRALFVPAIAVLPSERGHRVFVVREGTAHAVEIELGHRTPERVEVSRGLAAGDTVIVTNLLRVREGGAVDPQPDTLARGAGEAAAAGGAAP